MWPSRSPSRPRGLQSGRVLALVALLAAAVASSVTAAPVNWVELTKRDQLGLDQGDETGLFTFDGSLLAHNGNGLFRGQVSPCVEWQKVVIPGVASGASYSVIGKYLFYVDAGGTQDVYFIEEGDQFSYANWRRVTNLGPGQGFLLPLVQFQDEVYAAFYPSGSDTFEIWRSADLGRLAMRWTKVVSGGFGDSQNRALGFMVEFNRKLIAATTLTRTGLFGDPGSYLNGIELWESSSGDAASWKQINVDGFGTTVDYSGTIVRTNHDVGGYAIYQGQLYVGTRAHLGGEIWRYDGSGQGGWTNVTPPWTGVGFGSGPSRHNALAAFQGKLYSAEGFPTGNLAVYDGRTWSVVVPGPNPFYSDNGGLSSLAVLGRKLFVSTLHAFGATNPRGDQVWGFPFPSQPSTCIGQLFYELLYDPPKIRIPWWNHLELEAVLRNQGEVPVDQPYELSYYLDSELIHQEGGFPLAPGEARILDAGIEVPDGEHTLTLVIDEEGSLPEGSKDDNVVSVSFLAVPEEQLAEQGQQLDLLLAVGVNRVCNGDASHQLRLSWDSAGETEPYAASIEYPDGTIEELELPYDHGDWRLDKTAIRGGMITATLFGDSPSGARTRALYTYLYPCSDLPAGEAIFLDGFETGDSLRWSLFSP